MKVTQWNVGILEYWKKGEGIASSPYSCELIIYSIIPGA